MPIPQTSLVVIGEPANRTEPKIWVMYELPTTRPKSTFGRFLELMQPFSKDECCSRVQET